MNMSLYPALLKMPFRIRLCPQHISNQTDAHERANNAPEHTLFSNQLPIGAQIGTNGFAI